LDLQTWVRIVFGSVSVYTAWALSCGGVTGIVSLCFKQEFGYSVWWFVLGTFLPLGPLTWKHASSETLRATLADWKKMWEDGLMTERQYQQLRAAAIEWHKARWFSRSQLAPDSEGDDAAEKK
jgi:hypothetical protein